MYSSVTCRCTASRVSHTSRCPVTASYGAGSRSASPVSRVTTDSTTPKFLSSSREMSFFACSSAGSRSLEMRTMRSRQSAAFFRTTGKMERENRMRVTSPATVSASSFPPMLAIADSAKHCTGSCVDCRSFLIAWITSFICSSVFFIITDTATYPTSFSAYVGEETREIISMCPKSTSQPSMWINTSFHTYFFMSYGVSFPPENAFRMLASSLSTR